MPFPTSPANKQLYTSPSGTVYRYDVTDNKWVKPSEQLLFDPSLSLAMQFDGVDGHASSSTAGRLGGADTDVTIALWFKRNGAPSGNVNEFILTRDLASNGGRSYKIFVRGDGTGQTGKVRVSLNQGGGNFFGKQYETTANLCDNTWHHLVASFDSSGSSLGIYVDGVEDTTVTKLVDDAMTNLYTGSTAPLYMARDQNGNYFQGPIAGLVGFQGYAFLQPDVTELYGGGTSGAIRPKFHSQAGSILYAYDGMVPGDSMASGTGQLQNASNGSDGPLTPSGTLVSDLISFP